NMGRSFMLPVAVLPPVALLVGFAYIIGSDGLAGDNIISLALFGAGTTVLDNLSLLFAVGLSFGMYKDKSGAEAITGLVSFLVVTNVRNADAMELFKGIPADEVTGAFTVIDNNVLIGILTGLISAALYNKFSNVKLPDYLAFFSGRRAVPIISVFVMFALAGLMSMVMPIMTNG